MKKTIRVSRDYTNVKNVGIEIGIVTKPIGQHNHAFQVFPLENTIPEIGTIGVKNEIFALSFAPDFYGRFACAVYLDGIHTQQSFGINSINAIPEHLRSDSRAHSGRFISENKDKNLSYLDRYSQKNGENRLFQFTSNKNSGINEVLISDPSLTNKIEVYIWKEYVDEYDNDIDELPGDYEYSDFSPISKIGAGKTTNRAFKSGLPLNNPTFLGKATFVHQPSEKLEHLGKTLVPLKIDDPMDHVPSA